MKFTIHTSILALPVQECVSLVGSKVMPILEHLLVSVDANGLTLIGGNGEMYLKTIIAAGDLMITSPGSVALPAKKFAEMIKSLDGEISISVTGLKAIIQSGKTKLELSGLEGDEYPQFPNHLGKSLCIDGVKLVEIIQKSSYATATKEHTPILKGVALTLADQQIQARATDRHRAALINDQVSGAEGDFKVVIPASSCDKLCKLIDPNELVNISSSDNYFTVSTTHFVFTTRVLSGTYPDPDRLVSQLNFRTTFTIDTIKLMQTIKRALIIADAKVNIIRLSVTSEEAEVYCEYDGNIFSESVSIEKFTGDPLKLAFNAKYALDALVAIQSSHIEVGLTGRETPFRLSPIEAPSDNVHILLPYRTTS